MLICHVCNAECEEDIELCPVCGAQLNIVSQKSNDTTSESDILKNPTLLTAFEDMISAEIFKDILIENGIHFTSSSEMGEALQVTFGGVLVSEDIYVAESDMEKATELLESFSELEIEFDDNFDGEEN